MNFRDDYYSSDSSSSSSEDEINEEDFHPEGSSKPASKVEDPSSSSSSSLWSRTILHLDVDCFYAQCEELEHPEYKHRPIAIGQKHIIVTSNYVARHQFGVRKLQLKSDAMKLCPSLLIIDGSDLTRYRQYSRRIYREFRECVKQLCVKYHVDSRKVAVRKGGMDELFADVSALVDETTNDFSSLPTNVFVYGDNSNTNAASNSIAITEDQSGAQATVSFDDDPMSSCHSSSYNAHVQYGNLSDRQDCQRRLYSAANLCETIRQSIITSTGFTTTIGVSVSPMLAKLSSDLHKPNSLNVLLPWRSSSIILSMPLRKVPELGSCTLKALASCLERVHSHRKPDFWTCRDLLQCSQHDVARALEQLQSYEKTSMEISRLLLQKCRGVDTAEIVDDNGGMAKTVSVENSFQRDTIKTREQVQNAMDELYVRLPKLLEERRDDSDRPELAYPTTIRLTARTVDRSIAAKRRRPFITHSRQVGFDGKGLMMKSKDPQERCALLRKTVSPLLDALVFQGADINVTRLNVAATNFQDVVVGSANETQSTSIARMFSKQPAVKRDRPSKSFREEAEGVARVHEKTHTRRTSDDNDLSCPDGIDPSVLAELPPDIAAEVRRTYSATSTVRRSTVHRPSKKAKTIDSFFSPKTKTNARR